MIVWRVDDRLRTRLADLPAGAATDLRTACSHKNPEHYKLKSMGKWPGEREPPVIRTWHEAAGELSLPRGATEAVRSAMKTHGLRASWVDQRCSGDPALAGRTPPHRLELWPHQERIVEAALKRENCLVRAPTGSGKTSAAIALIARLQLPALVVVWNGALLEQWVERLCDEDELGLEPSEVGVIGGGKLRVRPITVAMQQSLWSSPERMDIARSKFGVVIGDEIQRAAARTFVEVFDQLPARYRVGMSASEKRRDKKEFLTYDMFGGVAVDIKRGELIEAGIVHDVEVRVAPTDFRADWYREQGASDDETPDFNKLLDEMTTDPHRNEIVAGVMAVQAREGCSVLAFTHRRDHALSIRAMMAARGEPCGLMLGGQESAEDFADAKHQMKVGRLLLSAGTYQAIGQGIDIPAVDRGVCATPCASNKQMFGQVRGRVCRTAEGKSDAVLYYLWDQHVFGLQALVNLNRWNRKVVVFDRGQWVPAKEYMEERWRKRSA